MPDAEAVDIAYLAGYADASRTVVKLTVTNLILKSMILLLGLLLLSLIRRLAP